MSRLDYGTSVSLPWHFASGAVVLPWAYGAPLRFRGGGAWSCWQLSPPPCLGSFSVDRHECIPAWFAIDQDRTCLSAVLRSNGYWCETSRRDDTQRTSTEIPVQGIPTSTARCSRIVVSQQVDENGSRICRRHRLSRASAENHDVRTLLDVVLRLISQRFEIDSWCGSSIRCLDCFVWFPALFC